MKKLLIELENLVNQEVIDSNTATRISQYYQGQDKIKPNRLLIIFGILGACLIGLGVILIVAHNWDDLHKVSKTLLAFLPLGLTQGLFGYTLKQKRQSVTWREVSSILLFFSLAVCIALISQIYQIEGDLRSFLLTWAVLALPIVFLMPSSVVSLFMLILIARIHPAYFERWSSKTTYPTLMWDQAVLFCVMLGHYWYLIRHKPKSLFTVWHHWLIPLAFVSLFYISAIKAELLYGNILMLLVLGLLYNIGQTSYFRHKKLTHNPYLVIGAIGTIVILFFSSYLWFWEDRIFDNRDLELHELSYYLTTISIAVISFYLIVQNFIKQGFKKLRPIQFAFLAFIVASYAGLVSDHFAMILSNIWLLTIGLFYIYDGLRENHLPRMNLGVLVLSSMILMRFFEYNVSFVGRGISFVLFGCAFFAANYYLIKKSK